MRSTTRDTAGVPVYKPDIYSADAIVNPYPHYQRLRNLGSVVWLSKQKVYALPRYAECKAVLRDDETFRSGKGVALNAISNRLSRGTTLNSDGDEHDRRRKLLAHGMLPRALREISEAVDATAAAVVDAALNKSEIDGVSDLAAALPLAVVPDLIGWPRDQRDHLIDWGGATFDVPRSTQLASDQGDAACVANAALRPSGRAQAHLSRRQHGT